VALPTSEPDGSTPLDLGPSWVGKTPDAKSRAIKEWADALDVANGVAPPAARPTNDALLDGMRNGAWLDAQDFPPLRYAVPGLVPEGLSLMVGAPKIGKSWWTLDACLAVSAGGYALGRILVGDARPVLYLALEDSDRRMQDRCRQLLDGASIPPKFEYMTRVASPGDVTPTVAAWLAWHRDEQPFVVIDTLGKAMPLASQGETVYQRDYRIMGDLKQLCDAELGASIVVNHHDRKAAADDFVDLASGTNGLAGGADTLLVLSRDRGEHAGLLRVTGRDVPEGAYALTLVPGTWWRLNGANLEEASAAAGSARAAAGLGDRSAAIIAYIGQHPSGVRADDIAAALNMQVNQVGVYLVRLHKSGRIERQQRGLYVPVGSVGSVVFEHVVAQEHNTTNATNAPIQSALPPGWLDHDDQRRGATMAAGQRYKAEHQGRG
jgi:hypothetical protein